MPSQLHGCAGVRAAWAVRHRPVGAPGAGPAFHSFLLLGFGGSTKVLETGEELREVTDRSGAARRMASPGPHRPARLQQPACLRPVRSRLGDPTAAVLCPHVARSVEFAVDVPTVAAGSVCGGQRIVQAFPQGFRLLGALPTGWVSLPCQQPGWNAGLPRTQ